MNKVLLLTLLLLAPLAANAQDEYEYKMEIGVGAGVVSYQGDFNGSIVKNMQPPASLLVRRVFNPYMGVKLDFSYGKLKGSSADVKTWYPELHDNPVEFSNTMMDLGLTFEYNFWPYGTGREYRGAKRLTPFVFMCIGATYDVAGDESVFTATVPVGVGVKYKIVRRLNLGLEWAVHFSLSDKLAGGENPYGLAGDS